MIVRRLLVVALLLAVTAGASFAFGQAAGKEIGETEVLASDLSTTGAALGPDGALYVAAPGNGDQEVTLPEALGGGTAFFGLNSTIMRVDPDTGDVTTAAKGLPSASEEAGGEPAGLGPADLAFIGDRMYALITGGANYAGGSAANYPNGIYRLEGDGSWSVVADMSAFNDENPVEFPDAGPGGNPFSMTVRGQEFIVSDGNYNRLLRVTVDGDISILASFDNVVPTGTESGATGPVYVTWFSPGPFTPGTSKLQEIGFPTGRVTELASGTQLIDVEIGPGGNLYVLSLGEPAGGDEGEGPPAVPFTGQLMVLDGGELKTVVSGLTMPTSLDFSGDTAFIASLGGDVWKIEGVSAIAPQAVQPSPTAAPPPAAVPTARPGIVAPDTGTGDSTRGGGSMVWLLAMALLATTGIAAAAAGVRVKMR